MTLEQHQPTPEEAKKIKEIMTPDMEADSAEREAQSLVEVLNKEVGSNKYFINKTSNGFHVQNIGQSFEYTDQGVKELETTVGGIISDLEQMDEKAWAELKSINVNNLPVTDNVKNDGSPMLARIWRKSYRTSNVLRIGEKVITFGKSKSATEAYEWAIENGAIDYDEYVVREEIKKAKNPELRKEGRSSDYIGVGRTRTTLGTDDSPRTYTFAGVTLGTVNDPLYKLAKNLIEEKKRGEFEHIEELAHELMEVLPFSLSITAIHSRTKSSPVINLIGSADEVSKSIRSLGWEPGDLPSRGRTIEINGVRVSLDRGEAMNRTNILMATRATMLNICRQRIEKDPAEAKRLIESSRLETKQRMTLQESSSLVPHEGIVEPSEPEAGAIKKTPIASQQPESESIKPVSEGGERPAEDRLQALRDRFKK